MNSGWPFLVSVVVPAWNEEQSLGACLESLARQDYESDFEIIVVDNASTDRTADIARQLGVRVVRCGTRGVLHARRAGARAARGEVIAQADADTVYPPTWLARIVHELSSHPEASFAKHLATRFRLALDRRLVRVNTVRRAVVGVAFGVARPPLLRMPARSRGTADAAGRRARRILRDGHVIGNHTYAHSANHALYTGGRSGIGAAEETIFRYTGVRPHLYRPPHGKKTPWELDYVRDHGLVEVTWSVAANDQHVRSAEKFAQAIVARRRDGGVILLHDGYGTLHGTAKSDRSLTVEALPLIIEGLQRHGYRFVTVPELFHIPAYDSSGG